MKSVCTFPNSAWHAAWPLSHVRGSVLAVHWLSNAVEEDDLVDARCRMFTVTVR